MESTEKKKRILHIEDNETLRYLAFRALKGYELVQPSKLEEALSKLDDSEKFDAIITDGLEGDWKKVYGKARIKSEYKNIPFIVHTSNVDVMDDVEKIMKDDKELGLIKKPNNISDFQIYIASFISRY
jgi:DNA-binding NtrC family response regulator